MNVINVHVTNLNCIKSQAYGGHCLTNGSPKKALEKVWVTLQNTCKVGLEITLLSSEVTTIVIRPHLIEHAFQEYQHQLRILHFNLLFVDGSDLSKDTKDKQILHTFDAVMNGQFHNISETKSNLVALFLK